MEPVARHAGRGARGHRNLRARDLSAHAAPWPLLRDLHRGDLDDRAADRRDLGVHQREPRPLHPDADGRSEEHTSELQSQSNLVCRLLLEKKKKLKQTQNTVAYETM